MSGASASGSAPKIVEFHPSSRRAPLEIGVLLALAGFAEVLGVFLALRSRVPAQVAWHFGVSGRPDAWASPLDTLAFAAVEIAVISAVFLLALWWIGRSPALAAAFRGRVSAPLLALQGVVVVGLLPLVFGLTFASAAGAIGISGTPLGQLFLVLGLGSAGAILVVLGLLGRGLVPKVRSSVPEPTHHARFAVGGPVDLACPACGEKYRIDGVPLLAPHIGIGRVGSLYLKCPRCGESGWNAIVGKVAA